MSTSPAFLLLAVVVMGCCFCKQSPATPCMSRCYTEWGICADSCDPPGRCYDVCDQELRACGQACSGRVRGNGKRSSGIEYLGMDEDY